MTLDELYEQASTTPSDIYEHLPKMVELVKRTNARHVIELGSRSGVSTIGWLYALQQTGGHLTSIDLDQAPGIGVWSNWCHIQGNDLNPDIVAALAPADVVFIDTSHGYWQTGQELNTYRWLVNPGGVICGHDSELARPDDAPVGDPIYPVKRAVEEFIAETGFTWVNHPECFGFYVIEVV